VGNTSFILEQVLGGKTLSGNYVVFASAYMTMVAVDMKTMKPVAVPEVYLPKLKNASL
jgi:acyl-CoA thioester hydrolase